MGYTIAGGGSAAAIRITAEGTAEAIKNINNVASTLDKLPSAAKSMEVAFARAKVALTGLVAGFSAHALIDMVRGAIDVADGLNDLSKSTGIAVDQLAGLKLAAKQSGGDLDGIAASINKLSVNMGKDAEKFAKLGVTAKDPLEAFKQLADMYVAVQDPQLRAAMGAEALGKSWASAAPLLAEGGNSIGEMVEKGARLSGVTQDMANSADAFNDKMEELSFAAAGAKAKIVGDLLPGLVQATTAIVTAYEESGKLQAAWVALGAFGTLTFTDEFSSSTVKLKNLNKELDDLYSSRNVVEGPGGTLLARLFGTPEDFAARIASVRAQIKTIEDAPGLAAKANKEAADRAKANKAVDDQAAKSAAAKAAAFIKGDADNKKEIEAYASLIASIEAKTAENLLELSTNELVSESQKTSIKLDKDLAAGKLVLTSAHLKLTRAKLSDQSASEQLLKAQKAEKEVVAWVNASTAARYASYDALDAEYAMYGKSADARDLALVAIKSEGELVQWLAEQKKANLKISDDMLDQLRTEKGYRDEVTRSAMAQTKTLSYAAQLTEENKRFAAESIFDEKARAAALLAIDADLWKERIALAGDGTKAQQLLQEQFTTWYQNQALKPELDAQRKLWDSIDQTAHDTFVSIFDSGKSAFDRLRDTLKNGLLDLLYQMTVKKWILNIGASVSSSGVGGIAQAAGGAGDAAGGLSSMYSGLTSATGLYNAYTSSSLGQFMSGYSGSAGAASEALGAPMTSAAQYGQSAANGLSGAAGAPYLGMAAGGLAAWQTSQGRGAVGGGIVGTAAGAGTIAAGGALTGAMSGAAGATAMGGATAALAAVPVWGWIAIAALAILGGMQDGPEEATRLAFGSNNAAGNISINERGNEGKSDAYVAGVSSKGAFGTFGVTSTFWMEAAQPAVQSFVQTVTQTDDALAKFMTSTEQAATVAALTGHTMTSNSGAEGSDPNGLGGLDAVFADRIKTIFDTVDPSLNAMLDGFKGTSQELATEATALLDYRKNLPAASEAIFGAVVTLKDLAALRSPTEAVSAALTRVTNAFTSTNSVIEPLGVSAEKAFGAVGLASLDARQALIDAAGGMSALNAGASNFAQNFLTDAQKLAPVVEALSKRMNDLGYAGVATADGYKDAVLNLVSSGALATTAGASTYVELLKLASDFKMVGDASAAADAAVAANKSAADALAASVSKESHSMDIQLMTALGDAEGALAATRADALSSLLSDDARVKQQKIWAADDANSAIAAAATVAAAQRGLDIQLMTAMGDAEGALAATRSDALAALLTDQARATQAQIWAADAASEAIAKAQASATAAATAAASAAADQAKAWGDMGNVFADSINRAKDMAKAFRDLNDSLLIGDSSTLDPGAKYAEAKRQFEGASPDNLQAAESAFLAASKAWFGGSAGYASDFAAVLARNSVAAMQQDTQASNLAQMYKELRAMGLGGVDGSHANGLDFVPFDNYRANLHRGERVQTAAAVKNGDAAAARTNALLEELIAEMRADKAQRGAIGVESLSRLDTLADKADATRRQLARAS